LHFLFFLLHKRLPRRSRFCSPIDKGKKTKKKNRQVRLNEQHNKWHGLGHLATRQLHLKAGQKQRCHRDARLCIRGGMPLNRLPPAIIRCFSRHAQWRQARGGTRPL
jgi:hypothetical protein